MCHRYVIHRYPDAQRESFDIIIPDSHTGLGVILLITSGHTDIEFLRIFEGKYFTHELL